MRFVTKEGPEGLKKRSLPSDFLLLTVGSVRFISLFSYVSRLFTFKEGFIGEVAAVGIGLGHDF